MNSIDVESTKKTIEQYRKENKESIQKNRSKLVSKSWGESEKSLSYISKEALRLFFAKIYGNIQKKLNRLLAIKTMLCTLIEKP